MTTIVRNISFDAADPYRLATWWGRVFGQPVYADDQPGGDEAGVNLPGGQTLYFQRVPEGKHDEPRTDRKALTSPNGVDLSDSRDVL